MVLSVFKMANKNQRKKQKKKRSKNIGMRSPMGKSPSPNSIVEGITKAYS